MGTLAWELAGSGYPLGGADRVNCTDEKDEVLEEQMKLVNLFLNSTAYWPKEKNQITAAADTFKNEVEGQKE